MWTLRDTVSVGSEVTAPELVDYLGAPCGSQPRRRFHEQYRCSARILLRAKSVTGAAPREGSTGLVPTGSCPTLDPELMFLGEEPPANAPASTPAGPHMALGHSQPQGHCFVHSSLLMTFIQETLSLLWQKRDSLAGEGAQIAFYGWGSSPAGGPRGNQG